MEIISFLENKASENDQFITNGTIDDLVVPTDLSTIDDKAAYQMSLRPLRYRDKDTNYIYLQKKMVEWFFFNCHNFKNMINIAISNTTVMESQWFVGLKTGGSIAVFSNMEESLLMDSSIMNFLPIQWLV
jgi:hypothetical protein